jgi:hypothetical protein
MEETPREEGPMLGGSGRLGRWIAVGAVTGAALTGAACGGGDGDPASNVGAAPVIGSGLPREVDHPVTEAVDRLQEAFVADDVDGVCDLVTRGAQLQAGSAAHGDPTTCERDLRKLFSMIEKGGGWRAQGEPRVTAVEADGDHAVATVALDRRWKAELPFARRNGTWRLNGFFGVPTQRAQSVSGAIPRASFPPAEGAGVEVLDADGSPCPALTDEDYPVVGGGCGIRISSRGMPMNILTAFGYFKFDDCSLDYRVRVDGEGRTWTEPIEVEGAAGAKPTDSGGCGDVATCFNEALDESVPWRGRLRGDGSGGFVHHVDMCLRTCVGSFIGDLVVRLIPEGDGWRAEAVDGGGPAGFRFEGPLTVRTDAEIRTVGS